VLSRAFEHHPRRRGGGGGRRRRRLRCFPFGMFSLLPHLLFTPAASLSFAVGEVPPSLLPHLSLSLSFSVLTTYLARWLAGRHFTHLFMCNLLG